MLQRKNRRILMLPAGLIDPAPCSPRREFPKNELADMAESIRRNGILQPLLVREKGARYELISGERRLRGARIAGLDPVPCLLMRAADSEAALLSIIENSQHRGIGFFEEAEAIRRLVELMGITQEEAAHRLGVGQSEIADKLRLLRIEQCDRQRITAAGLSREHAQLVAATPEGDPRKRLLGEMISRGLSVPDSRRAADLIISGERERPVKRPIVRDIRLFFNTLSHAIETMKSSGVPVRSSTEETEEYFECSIRIPK